MKLSGFPRRTWVARLSIEAEWEYACRAGSETDFYRGDGENALAEVAWYEEDSRGMERHPAWLRGMHGNLREWCHDEYYPDTFWRRLDRE